MEGILEFFATLGADILSVIKFKNQKVRTWTITVFVLLVGVMLVGLLLWDTLGGWDNLTPAGKIVMGVVTGVFAVGFLIFIICKHRKNWKSF